MTDAGWKDEIEELRRRKQLAAEMRGAARVERQRSRGKLTVRERIAALLDQGSFREWGSLAGEGQYDAASQLTAFRASSCLAGRVEIDGRTVVVSADDFTIRGGSSESYHHEKNAQAAFFGAPVAHEDDPLRAVMAALDVIKVAEEYSRAVRQQCGVEFAMRACLNYGLVMLGSVDKDLKYDFTSLGGVINLAARLKFAAQPMSVLIADTVQRFVSPVFDYLDLGIIEVKGRSEPVRAYQVLDYKVEPGTLRGLVGLESPMVGRDRELERLVQLCETVRAGLGRAVLIIGEPGMGTTRLIAEWQAAVVRKANLPSVQWAEGHSHSYAQGLVYHLLIHLVYSLLGVSESAGEAKIHSALYSLVGDLYENPDTTPGLEVYTLLAHLLSLKLRGTP